MQSTQFGRREVIVLSEEEIEVQRIEGDLPRARELFKSSIFFC